MVSIRYCYILKYGDTFISGSTYYPEVVIKNMRKTYPDAMFVVVCALGVREAAKAVKFMKRMKPADYAYWSRQSGLLQARWIFKAGGTEPDLAMDYSNLYNKRE